MHWYKTTSLIGTDSKYVADTIFCNDRDASLSKSNFSTLTNWNSTGVNYYYRGISKFYGDYEAYKYPVTKSLKDIRDIYKWDVTCQGSVPAAIRCVLEANSYEEFIRNVMSLPCDMDTLGAIGGGIAEELFGFGDIDVDGILEQFLEPCLIKLG